MIMAFAIQRPCYNVPAFLRDRLQEYLISPPRSNTVKFGLNTSAGTIHALEVIICFPVEFSSSAVIESQGVRLDLAFDF